MNLNSEGIFTPEKVVKATGIVTLLTFTARILSYFKIVVFANRFSTTLSLDAYLLALIIPTLLGIQVADGLTNSVIPVLSRYSAQERKERDFFLSSLINCTFLALLVVTSFFLAGAPLLSRLLAPGFEGESLVLLTRLLSLLLLTVILNGMMGILRGFLEFEGSFTLPACFLIIRDVAIIGFAWFLSGKIGILSAAYGNLCGAIGGFLLLIFGLTRKPMVYRVRLCFRHPAVREVFRLMLPILGVMAFTQGTIYVDRIMVGSLLPQEGNISILTFGFWIVQIPVFVFVSPLSTVFFPLFSRLSGAGERDKLRDNLSLALRLALLVIIPGTAGLVILRVPLISQFLQHGRFGHQDTEAVSRVLLYYAAGMLPLALMYILTAAHYALKKVITLLRITGIMFLANILFNFILIRYLGLRGIALSTSFVLTIGMAIMLKTLKGKIKGREIINSLSKFFLSAILMGAGCFFLEGKLEPLNFLSLMIVVFSGLIIYVAFLFLLRAKEIKALGSLLRGE